MNEPSPNSVRVIFRLQRDADGYPPDDEESLWATPIGDGRFTLDNIPFFIRGVSVGDVVSAVSTGDEYHFTRVERPSGHSTIRVIVDDESKVPDLRKRLAKLGCSSELSHLPILFAVDVPPEASLSNVISFLKHAEKHASIEFEKAALRHTEEHAGVWWKGRAKD